MEGVGDEHTPRHRLHTYYLPTGPAAWLKITPDLRLPRMRMTTTKRIHNPQFDTLLIEHFGHGVSASDL